MTFLDWFEGIRLGLDFGPKGVGVAVVRGRSVLFAQSLLNLGGVDLDDRRGHRRSRRTHRMRQRRLRRFRKYCLTHGLPDPVPLAHTSTAFHPLLKDSHQPNPRWQNLPEIRGRLLAGRGTPEDFVRFCYDMCRRRGFTYDSLIESARRALRPKRGKTPMPADVEKKLIEELKDAQVPESILEEIRKILRENGYDKLVQSDSELEKEMIEATKRSSEAREPRGKRPREAVRKELEEVCRANPLFVSHEAELWEIIDWRPRPLRIDNRASTMWKCSWCQERWRPRLVNLTKDEDPLVRDGLLWEAIHNLRHKHIKDQAAAVRPWWTKSFGKESKKKGVPPSDETLHDIFRDLKAISINAGRVGVVKEIGKIFKVYRLADSEKEKFADLLCPREKDEGRSKRCRDCIKLGAQATTPEDWRRIREMVVTRRRENEATSRMEIWLDRCVKAILKSLFYSDPKGKLRFRYESVTTISLEVPRFDPEEGKTAKRRLEDANQRRDWPFLRQRWLQQRETCIYCGEKRFSLKEEPRADGSVRYLLPAGFQDEHIFPRNKQYNGQDHQLNRVIACDNCNGNLKERYTPWHWMKDQPEAWKQFQQRVHESLLPQTTKALLLGTQDRYPDPVDLLARSGQIRKVLAEKLKNLFREVGCDLSDQEIVFVDGATTQLARQTWKTTVDVNGNPIPNFPTKDRDHPAHHAQDATLAASIPPHYLRRIGEWLYLGRPHVKFAPNWMSYEFSLKRKPLSIDLTRRRYDWHEQQWDDSIYGRDAMGRFFVRKAISKANPDQLPEGSNWAREAIASGAKELMTPGTTDKVRGLKIYPTDVGPTSMQEERPGSGRWRKTLLARAWVALRQINGEVELRFPEPGEARRKPTERDGWWTLERGNIVWLKQAEQREVGGIPHTWQAGWYRLTKISGKGDGLTFEPCDQSLPYTVSKKNGKEKKEYRDLTLNKKNLLLLRWPRTKC